MSNRHFSVFFYNLMNDLTKLSNSVWFCDYTTEPVFAVICQDWIIGITAGHNSLDPRVYAKQQFYGFLTAHCPGDRQVHDNQVKWLPLVSPLLKIPYRL